MKSDPKSWRDTLYRNYSQNFSEGKDYDPSIQWSQYDQVYGELLARGEAESPVLDLGCGKGEWLAWMRSKGWQNLSGVDLSEADLAVAAASGMKVHCEDAISYLKSNPAGFAVIHAKDIIEHLDKQELVDFALAVHEALQPGGVFVASTFNAQAPLASTTRYGDFTHESGLTCSSAGQWLRACGFSDVTVRGTHFCPRSLKGRIRKILYSVVAGVAKFVVTLRHGVTTQVSCLPDLLIIAKKS